MSMVDEMRVSDKIDVLFKEVCARERKWFLPQSN